MTFILCNNLLVVIVLLKATSGEEGQCECVTSPPLDQVASQGEWVVFHCEVSSQFQEWQVNGQLTSQLGSGYISTDDDFHDGVHTISLSGLRNEDSVECVCRHLIQSGEWEVCNSSASVTLQDQLGPVGNIQLKSNMNSINISWSKPYEVDETVVNDDIWYTILICNVTYIHTPTSANCSHVNTMQTYYIFSPEHPSPCHQYTFTVIPFNGAGQGESSQPVAGAFHPGLEEACNPELPAVWNVFHTPGCLCLMSACHIGTGVFIVVERASHSSLHVMEGRENTYSIGLNSDAITRVQVYTAEQSGLPSNRSLPHFEQKVDQEANLEDTGDDYISRFNLADSTLEADGLEGSLVCNLESSNVTGCAAMCLNDRSDELLLFIYHVGVEFPQYFLLRNGSHKCGVISVLPGRVVESSGSLLSFNQVGGKEEGESDSEGGELRVLYVLAGAVVGVCTAVLIGCYLCWRRRVRQKFKLEHTEDGNIAPLGHGNAHGHTQQRSSTSTCTSKPGIKDSDQQEKRPLLTKEEEPGKATHKSANEETKSEPEMQEQGNVEEERDHVPEGEEQGQVPEGVFKSAMEASNSEHAMLKTRALVPGREELTCGTQWSSERVVAGKGDDDQSKPISGVLCVADQTGDSDKTQVIFITPVVQKLFVKPKDPVSHASSENPHGNTEPIPGQRAACPVVSHDKEPQESTMIRKPTRPVRNPRESNTTRKAEIDSRESATGEDSLSDPTQPCVSTTGPDHNNGGDDGKTVTPIPERTPTNLGMFDV